MIMNGNYHPLSLTILEKGLNISKLLTDIVSESTSTLLIKDSKKIWRAVYGKGDSR